jgi:catalase
MKDTLEGRVVGLLVAEGAEAKAVGALAKAVSTAGAQLKTVAAHIGSIKLSDGSPLPIDGQLAGTPSVLFDAVAVILPEPAAATLGREAAAAEFLRDAFNHLKAIGFDKGGEALLDAAGIPRDAGTMAIGALEGFIAAARTRQWGREAQVRKPA